MNKTELLLHRLNEIGDALSHKPTALALIGLGSVGLERDRLDQYSDLDFFVIVKSGSKPHYLNDLTWLTDIAPVAYYFANTPDGCKLLCKSNW
jgi:UTP:GlnB (protein PII) uridylyltransferase